MLRLCLSVCLSVGLVCGLFSSLCLALLACPPALQHLHLHPSCPEEAAGESTPANRRKTYENQALTNCNRIKSKGKPKENIRKPNENHGKPKLRKRELGHHRPSRGTQGDAPGVRQQVLGFELMFSMLCLRISHVFLWFSQVFVKPS